MPGHIGRAAFAAVLSLLSDTAGAAPVAVPAALEGWRAWALDGQEYRRCPFVSASAAQGAAAYRCAWPERLQLSLDARGGHFAQRWQLFAEAWVRLPGSPEHWPLEVRVDGTPGAVVAHEGTPALRLAPGSYTVTGRFAWQTRPESIPVDPRTALVDLVVDGRGVAQPERPQGSVWLGKRRTAEQAQRMEVQVYRLLRDTLPVRLLTRVRLQVAGEAREVSLGHALPAGFVPLSIESALPARLDPDGRLRVQVRPGSWDVTLAARGPSVATQLARPKPEGLWAREEVWSFESQDQLRIAAVEGAEGIDPAQANVPEEWRALPAFRMAADSRLTIAERSRGLQSGDDNSLMLRRQLWLDFDHGGMVARDFIRGTMRRDWRLETAAPFAVQSASHAREDLLVTRSPEGKRVGVEVRTPALWFHATSRSSVSSGSMPASGWKGRFDSVQGDLHLPPGHRLLAVAGADSAPMAWIERWGLWDLFGVLVVAVFAGWLAGPVVGGVAFAALTLAYQESPAYIWLWANVLAAAALARAAPDGRLLGFARGYRLLSFAVLGAALLPLLWGQVRLALYPQLEMTRFEQFIDAESVEVSAGIAASDGAAPAAPPVEEVVVASESERKLSRDSSLSSGLNYSQVVQRYAPGTVIQAGPGIPAWRGNHYSYSWSGPVESDQTVRFVYLGPVLLGLWRIAAVVLLAALFAALLLGSGTIGWRPPAAWLDRFTRRRVAAAGLGFMLICAGPQIAKAEAPPDTGLLKELTTRLTRPPACVPSCTDIAAARVNVRADRLEIELDVSALAEVAVAMPGADDRWQIESVTVDGRSSLAMMREGDGSLWIPLKPGAHLVRLVGRLAAAESIQLAFPAPPRRISVTNDGWDAAGISENRLLSGSLELTRRRGAPGQVAALDAASEFPVFVRVNRQFDLGLDWNITTMVEREAPQKAAFSIEVPLVAGESVLSDGIKVRDSADGVRTALVGVERGQSGITWASGLPRGDRLALQMPQGAARSEVWRFTVSPQWNVVFEGLPAVQPGESGGEAWVYEFHPRPGEKLNLRIRRPEPAPGATLAIDSVDQRLAVGKRSTTTTLGLRYRSTQGGRHGFALPSGARVTQVLLDGEPVAVRPVDDELSIELRPGAHVVSVEWVTPSGAAFRTRPLPVDLHSPASNIGTRIELPANRWPLLASGPGYGPVITYWGELVIFIGMALLLGRVRNSPLRTHEWLLLGFGLSTRSWAVLVLVAFWLFALRWREAWGAGVSRWRFNTVQVLLAALTAVAVGGLVFSGIRGSLLATPDMGVAGAGSYGGSFAWFMDRSVSQLPEPQVISLPMWCYRALMFAWALWLVFALLGWLRRAWRAWKSGGIWRGRENVVAATP